MLKEYAVEVFDSDVEDVLWLSSKELVDFWHCLFNWCWTNGMIPTE